MVTKAKSNVDVILLKVIPMQPCVFFLAVGPPTNCWVLLSIASSEKNLGRKKWQQSCQSISRPKISRKGRCCISF